MVFTLYWTHKIRLIVIISVYTNDSQKKSLDPKQLWDRVKHGLNVLENQQELCAVESEWDEIP